MTPPNILLVVLDAARRDAFTPYGAPEGATPTVQLLADTGVAHPHAYATAPWTLPSHTAMFTGRPAATYGLDQAPGGDLLSVKPVIEGIGEQLLATVLGQAGYRCLGFSANLWVSQHSGFQTGFEKFAYAAPERAQHGSLKGGGPITRYAWAREGLESSSDDGAGQLGAALLDSIADADERPAFWFVNLVECHSPYLPPRPWNDLGIKDRIGAALDCERYLSWESICLHAAGKPQIPEQKLPRLRHLYECAIEYMDDWLHRILSALDEHGKLDDTLVIVTADHGESFGEDGQVAHGFTLGQQLIHVPLVVAGPGADQLPITAGAFSLAGLPELIANAAGLGQHPFAPQPTPGIAIARAEAICPPDDPRAQEFAAKWKLDAAAIARLTTTWTAATDGRYKLLVGDDGSEQLTDLEDTSATVAPEVAERLRAALAGRSNVPAPDLPAPPPAEADADTVAALERQMKLLGYM